MENYFNPIVRGDGTSRVLFSKNLADEGHTLSFDKYVDNVIHLLYMNHAEDIMRDIRIQYHGEKVLRMTVSTPEGTNIECTEEEITRFLDMFF